MVRRPKWLGGSSSSATKAQDAPGIGLSWQKLVEEETAEAERDKYQADHLGLIRYIDPALDDKGLVMPQLPPLAVLQFVAGAIEAKRQVDEMKHRARLIQIILWFSLIWLSVVLGIVLLSGFDSSGFNLDSSVLVALVTTTTANVLGLAFIILRGLFYKKYADHTPSGDG